MRTNISFYANFNLGFDKIHPQRWPLLMYMKDFRKTETTTNILDAFFFFFICQNPSFDIVDHNILLQKL